MQINSNKAQMVKVYLRRTAPLHLQPDNGN